MLDILKNFNRLFTLKQYYVSSNELACGETHLFSVKTKQTYCLFFSKSHSIAIIIKVMKLQLVDKMGKLFVVLRDKCVC